MQSIARSSFALTGTKLNPLSFLALPKVIHALVSKQRFGREHRSTVADRGQGKKTYHSFLLRMRISVTEPLLIRTSSKQLFISADQRDLPRV